MISNFYEISLNFYTSLFLPFLLFFNYELLVVICFFFFLLFALLSEKGQLGSSLYDISSVQRTNILKYLSQRQLTADGLISFLVNAVFEIKKISSSYDFASYDLLLNLQYAAKKVVFSLAVSQIRTYLEIITLRTQYLSLQIKLYLTTDLFVNQSFKFQRAYIGETLKSQKSKCSKYLII